MGDASVGLYVHVPFCAKKCPYCDFFSEAYRKRTVQRYVLAVCRRMEQFAEAGAVADTLYFGGGTPSLLSPVQISDMIGAARRCFALDGEITMEANPNTLTAERLCAYREAGVNRLSIGVQSFRDPELAALGRRHTAERAVRAVYDAAEAGFDDISIDLMLGVPYQTEESLLFTLQTAVSLPITHLSAYLLKVEEGTAYRESPLLAHCPDEDTLARIYLQTVSFLERHGFMQYEISNFAKTGRESRHNLKYWRCAPYLGIGPAAHSFFAGKRFASVPDICCFCEAAEGGAFDDLTLADDRAGGADERMMLALRLRQGVLLEELMHVIRTECGEKAGRFLRQLCEHALAETSSKRFALTPRGFLVSNEILSEILAFL